MYGRGPGGYYTRAVKNVRLRCSYEGGVELTMVMENKPIRLVVLVKLKEFFNVQINV